ncbi:MAG: hypothetical protein AB8H86_23660 [Polyangiales bacterium]
MSTQREWVWPYWSAYVGADGSVSWSNHEQKASKSQSGKDFLANGPDKVVASSVPSRVAREMRVVVSELLKGRRR